MYITAYILLYPNRYMYKYVQIPLLLSIPIVLSWQFHKNSTGTEFTHFLSKEHAVSIELVTLTLGISLGDDRVKFATKFHLIDTKVMARFVEYLQNSQLFITCVTLLTIQQNFSKYLMELCTFISLIATSVCVTFLLRNAMGEISRSCNNMNQPRSRFC